MFIIYLAPAVAVIGVLVYALATNGITKDIGRIMFACGLFVSLLSGIRKP